jgi:D-cysteine desulfhydrase
MNLSMPPKLKLANLPTPLEFLERSSQKLGVELWIKRDDLTGVGLSGNKVRKLEYLLHDAKERGADTLITCGGAQSNHCRATAVAAAKLGLKAHLLLRTEDPTAPPVSTGNILLDKMVGAKIHWISFADYGIRHEKMATLAATLQSQGHTPYVIPEGGSNGIGSWGYIEAAKEIGESLASMDEGAPKDTTLIYACGSGGTAGVD